MPPSARVCPAWRARLLPVVAPDCSDRAEEAGEVGERLVWMLVSTQQSTAT